VTFSWESPVFFDELDANGHLHNARFAVHVERAQSALFEQRGQDWDRPEERDADLYYVVRELHVEFLAPLSRPGLMRVLLTGERIGTTSARYGFQCGHDIVYARGYRVIVKVDPVTGRPAAWSEEYRRIFAELTP
jgi:acyl-CoA thioester hydrolase